MTHLFTATVDRSRGESVEDAIRDLERAQRALDCTEEQAPHAVADARAAVRLASKILKQLKQQETT